MDFVSFDLFLHDVLAGLLGLVDHPDPSHFKVVGHCKLRISIEANVLALLPVGVCLVFILVPLGP